MQERKPDMCNLPTLLRCGPAVLRRFRWTLLMLALAACSMTPQPAVLSPNDQTALLQVSSYLNGLQRFRAAFVQNGPRGEATGVVWVDRPGRLRVQYTAPGPQTILANHGELLIADASTGATTTLPVAKTPLDILLRPSIPLSGPVTVTALHHLPDRLSITLVKTEAPGQGSLTLLFSANPLALRGLIIQDRSGRLTSLALRDLIRNPQFPPGAFTAQPLQTAG